MKPARPTRSGRPLHYWGIPILFGALLGGCAAPSVTSTPAATITSEPQATATHSATLAAPTATATVQPTASPVTYGPDPADFPAGITVRFALRGAGHKACQSESPRLHKSEGRLS